jgi:hypothetical protein
VADWRLLNVWVDLRELTTAVDLAHRTKQLMSPFLFQETLVSVQYRLQHLIYNDHDQRGILRNALLVFTTITFLQDSIITTPRQALIRQLRPAIYSTYRRCEKAWLELILWLIFVSALSRIETAADYYWLQQQTLHTSQALELHTWDAVRQTLKAFLWIESVNDRAGEAFFNATMRLDYG